MKIVFASTNKMKINEVKNLFSNSGHELTYLCDYEDIQEPDEPYETFSENAVHKARHYAKLLKMPVLCDDAGICISAFGGAPGVHSKRFVQESGGLMQTFARLEKTLEGKDKSAYFQCSIVLHVPKTDETLISEGFLNGALAFPAMGDSYEAYDNIFVPEGYDKTLIELGIDLKNKISHRAKAIRELISKI